MEIFYLLCSIVSTSLTSLLLSLLLPFHALLQQWNSSRASSSFCNDEAEPISLYQGTVWHQRRHPVNHSFQYQVRYALIDLERAPHAPHDHLSLDEARQITDTNGPILLLTIPPSVGYEQNPLSVYYCYAVEGSTKRLKKCIAEVTNTPWGERVSFVFNPHSDLVAKALHVSPFMDMLGSWNIKANDPGENLTISISVHHPEHGNYFTASLKAKKLYPSPESDHAVFFWLMPHKVAVWIYWHVLDWMLGKGHAALLKRAELKTFVNFHGNEAGKGGDLTHDETTIITGALELTEKTAKDAMTPISKAFSLDLDATLNLETLNSIMTIGHSRVPVYAGEKTNIIGLVLVKNLFMVDSKAAVPLRKMLIRKIPRVSEKMPLYDILNEFQKGHSHIAVVYRDLNDKNEAPKIVKDGEQLDLKDKHKNKGENTSLDKGEKLESHYSLTTDGAQQAKKSPPVTPAFKKRHRGCSYCILDLDNSPLPVFPTNEVVVGVITMEDVIEELLQEEILDETDEYVNIHNKIKVNMNASKEKAPDANLLQPSQAVQGHTPTNSFSTATSATGSPTTIDLISESESLRNR